jgi:P27 family predicted phage terminase small subunit
MAKRGAKPKPTIQHHLRGTFRAGRHKHREEHAPKAEGDLTQMEPPFHLNDQDANIWREALSFAPAGVIARADTFLVEALATAVQDMRRARAAQTMLDEGRQLPFLTKGDGGKPAISPYMTIERRARDQVLRLCAELGLSPVARQRLAGVPAAPAPGQGLQPEDPWAAFQVIPGGRR